MLTMLCRPFGDLCYVGPLGDLSHLVTLAVFVLCRPFGDLMFDYCRPFGDLMLYVGPLVTAVVDYVM